VENLKGKVALSNFSGHPQWPEDAMRIAVLIALCCFASSAVGQKSDFQEPCSSHIQSTWPEELRKAAQADCNFFENAQRSGAGASRSKKMEVISMCGMEGSKDWKFHGIRG
jgi:hypothetical protein